MIVCYSGHLPLSDRAIDRSIRSFRVCGGATFCRCSIVDAGREMAEIEPRAHQLLRIAYATMTVTDEVADTVANAEPECVRDCKEAAVV
jgi:hypothetical protein